MQRHIPSEADMIRLGMSLAAFLKGDEIIYLQGELGAGKTTLVRGLLRGLGFEGRVTSPTFNLMNVYSSQPPVYHFDFYRLAGGDLDLALKALNGSLALFEDLGMSEQVQKTEENIELISEMKAESEKQ